MRENNKLVDRGNINDRSKNNRNYCNKLPKSKRGGALFCFNSKRKRIRWKMLGNSTIPKSRRGRDKEENNLRTSRELPGCSDFYHFVYLQIALIFLF